MNSKPIKTVKTATKAPDSCTPIDLNKSEPLKSMPVGEQGISKACYAWAAVVVEYELRLKGVINFSIAPIDIARQYKLKYPNEDKSGSFRSGMILDAIEVASTNGVIPFACVEDQIQAVIKNSHLSSGDVVGILDGEKLRDNKYADEEYFASKDALMKRIKACTKFPGFEAIEKIVAMSTNLASFVLLNACEKSRAKIPPIKCEKFSYAPEDKAQYLNDLNDILNKKKPAGASLCITRIESGHTGPIPTIEEDPEDKQCGSHAAVITGRRKFGGKCQYLLRNSWGGEWGHGHSTLKNCACRTPDGTYYEDCLTLEKLVEKERLSSSFSGSFHDDLDDDASFAEQYRQKEYVGCWVSSHLLVSNLMGIGGIK